MTRIMNVRCSVYFNYLSTLISDYAKALKPGQKVDFKDLRRYLDKQVRCRPQPRAPAAHEWLTAAGCCRRASPTGTQGSAAGSQ